jgi:hypothetical protein
MSEHDKTPPRFQFPFPAQTNYDWLKHFEGPRPGWKFLGILAHTVPASLGVVGLAFMLMWKFWP